MEIHHCEKYKVNLQRDEVAEPLNPEENAEQEQIIVNAIERRVAERNRINAARIAAGNTISADEIHPWALSSDYLFQKAAAG